MTRSFFRAELAAVFLTVVALSCSKAPVPTPSRCTGDVYGVLHSPLVTCDDAALLPAISIDLIRAPYTVAPPVGSKDILSVTSSGL